MNYIYSCKANKVYNCVCFSNSSKIIYAPKMLSLFKYGSVVDSFEIPPQLQSAPYQTEGYLLFFGYLLKMTQNSKNVIYVNSVDIFSKIVWMIRC